MNRPFTMDPFGARGVPLRGGLVLAALGAHLAAIGALWWQRSEPLPRLPLATIQVDWVAPVQALPVPTRTPPPVQAARPVPVPAPSPRPIAAAAAPVLSATPAPETAPVQVVPAVPSPVPSPAPSPAPSPVPSTTPSATPLAAPSSAVPTASSTAAETSLPAPPAPRRVTLTPTDWVRAPVYAYPREALRRREQGVVAVRIQFDAQGVPRQVSLLRSSGSASLDAEALAKARESRARPRLQDGVPFAFLADTEAEFKF